MYSGARQDMLRQILGDEVKQYKAELIKSGSTED